MVTQRKSVLVGNKSLPKPVVLDTFNNKEMAADARRINSLGVQK